MTVSTSRKKGKAALVLATVASLFLMASPYAFGLLTSANTLNTSGVIAGINLGVYSNSACTQALTSIAWGTCYPGENKTATAYIKNLGTVDTTLSFQNTNWSPTSASSYITVSANQAGRILKSNEVVTVIFNIKISASVTGINSFNFDIVVIGQG